MARAYYKFYSVYNRHTDEPVVIHGTALECMAVMKVTRATFYHYVTRTRRGRQCKYDIYVDDPDEEE